MLRHTSGAVSVSTERFKVKNLAIMSGFHRDAKYLPAWIAHHLNMGVEFFHLLNHQCSPDNWREVLEPFEDVVEVWDAPEAVVFPHRFLLQLEHLKDFRWVGYVNVDEYLIPDVPGTTAASVLAGLERFDAVGVHWLLFGTSGHRDSPAGLDMENYVWRPRQSFHPNQHIKSFVNPRTALHWPNMHVNISVPTVNTEGRVIPTAGNPPTYGAYADPYTEKGLRLNHYFTRSLEDWKTKVTLKYGGFGGRRKWEEYQSYDQKEEEDRRACIYGDAIRETMRKWCAV